MSILHLALAGLLATAAGCVYDQPKLPASLAEYDAMLHAGPRYPDLTILLLNRQRMMDDDCGEPQRVESLRLVHRLAGDEPGVRQDVRTLLCHPATPESLRQASLELTLATHTPFATTYAAFAANGYTFRQRDLHLIERLAADTSRQPFTRAQLVEKIRATLAAREHVHIAAPAPETDVLDPIPTRTASGPIDVFDDHLTTLTHADLWNIYLFQETLARPDVQRGLAAAVRDDRADTTSAWGGLIFYASQHADMVRYKTPAEEGRSDFRHAFNPKAVEAGRDALARFQFHFEKAHNTMRAGPTRADLADAAAFDAYGLILTTINDHALCAHYYTPQGAIVSLGVYTFAETKP